MAILFLHTEGMKAEREAHGMSVEHDRSRYAYYGKGNERSAADAAFQCKRKKKVSLERSFTWRAVHP